MFLKIYFEKIPLNLIKNKYVYYPELYTLIMQSKAIVSLKSCAVLGAQFRLYFIVSVWTITPGIKSSMKDDHCKSFPWDLN